MAYQSAADRSWSLQVGGSGFRVCASTGISGLQGLDCWSTNSWLMGTDIPIRAGVLVENPEGPKANLAQQRLP